MVFFLPSHCYLTKGSVKVKMRCSHHQFSAVYGSFICHFFCLGTAQWSRSRSVALCCSDLSKMHLFLRLKTHLFLMASGDWRRIRSHSQNTLWTLFLQTSRSSYYVYSFPFKWLVAFLAASKVKPHFSPGSRRAGPQRLIVYVCERRSKRFHLNYFRRFFSAQEVSPGLARRRRRRP